MLTPHLSFFLALVFILLGAVAAYLYVEVNNLKAAAIRKNSEMEVMKIKHETEIEVLNSNHKTEIKMADLRHEAELSAVLDEIELEFKAEAQKDTGDNSVKLLDGRDCYSVVYQEVVAETFELLGNGVWFNHTLGFGIWVKKSGKARAVTKKGKPVLVDDATLDTAFGLLKERHFGFPSR